MGGRGAMVATGLVAGALALAGCSSGGSAGSSGSAGSTGVIATVGSDTVTHTELDGALEAASGAQVLGGLIDSHIVLQAAAAKGITISDDEVNAAVAARSATEPGLAAAIAMGGPTADSVRRQLKVEMAVERLITSDVKVTDAALKTWYAQYHAKYYDTPAQVQIGIIVTSQKARADIMAQELAGKTKSFAELVGEQVKANDPVAKGSQAVMPKPIPVDHLPKMIAPSVLKLTPGGNTAPQALGKNGPWAIIRLVKSIPVVSPPLQSIRPEAEMDYKLMQVAKKAVGANPANPPFDTTLDRTAIYLNTQQRPSGLHDVLTYIDQNEAQAIVEGLRSGATVQIVDPAYARLQSQYKSSMATVTNPASATEPGPAASPAAAAGAAGAGAGAAGAGAGAAGATNAAPAAKAGATPAKG